MLTWLQAPNGRGLAVLLGALALWSTVGIAAAQALEPAESVLSSRDRVRESVLWLTASSPAHPVRTDAGYLEELASAIVTAADRYHLDPLLLTGMVFLESSFRTAARGGLGEVGLLQVHGAAATGCDLGTVAGQVDCGAAWLRVALDRCGGVEAALRAYASGDCSAEPGSRPHRAARVRLELAGRLREVAR